MRKAHDAARKAFWATARVLSDCYLKEENSKSDLKKALNALEAMPDCEALQDEVLRQQNEVSQARDGKSQASETLHSYKKELDDLKQTLESNEEETQNPGPGATDIIQFLVCFKLSPD